jgi:hypothetical protein
MEDEWKIADKIQQLYCELVIIKNELQLFHLLICNVKNIIIFSAIILLCAEL